MRDAGLWLEVFYSTNWVTWVAPQVPHVEVKLASTPGEAGPVVVFGKPDRRLEKDHPLAHLVKMVPFGSEGHLVVLPEERLTSRYVASFQWKNGHIEAEIGSTNPLQIRPWGHLRPQLYNASVFGSDAKDYAYQKFGPLIVGKVPGEGVWFRTVFEGDYGNFSASWAKTVASDPDLTPESPVDEDRFDEIASVLFCNGFAGNIDHMLAETSSCTQKGHNKRALHLGVLLAHYLKALTWPPGGWYLPPDEDKLLVNRYSYLGSKKHPSSYLGDVSAGLVQAGLQVDRFDTIDALVDLGLITWSALESTIGQMNARVPVAWTGDLAIPEGDFRKAKLAVDAEAEGIVHVCPDDVGRLAKQLKELRERRRSVR